jgi:hypothetical protein
MENEEITPGQTEQTLESEQTETVEPVAQSNDPLDLIQDRDALLAEAKKFRSIAQRKAKTETQKVENTIAPVASNSAFITRNDLEKIATRKAKELVGAEIAAEYDSLVKIPLGGYDSLDAESVAKNLKERFAILKARKPDGEKKEDISDLTATKVAVGTGAGGNKETKPDKKDPPNFSLPKKPTEWYLKKA